MKFIEKIFSVKNSKDKIHKIITICGLKLKFRCNQVGLTEDDVRKLLQANNNRLLHGVQRSITTAVLHQYSFGEYKYKHSNENIVLLGAGPTLNNYVPLKNAKYVGTNRTFLYDKVKLDYLFAIDKAGIEQYYEEFLAYKGNNCVKFIGDQNLGKNFQIPESIIAKSNGRRYKTNAKLMNKSFTLDIDTQPLVNFATVSLQALQFILFTKPAKVYLVGIDCNASTAGYFLGETFNVRTRGEIPSVTDASQLKQWTSIKSFVEIYYPETEIISVNPVGLRGVFRDVYTESYLKANPQLVEQLETIDVINEEGVITKWK